MVLKTVQKQVTTLNYLSGALRDDDKDNNNNNNNNNSNS